MSSSSIEPPPPPAFVVDKGSTAWVLMSTALVLFMTPGLGFFYAGGPVSSRSVMHTILSSMVALPLIGVQWFFSGYTLAFSTTGSSFIGEFQWIGLRNVNEEPNIPTYAPGVPHMVFCAFQLMFATVTPAIVFSGAAERIKVLPYMLFVVVWSTFVYDIIAYWAWAPNGWFKQMGGLDFAGGMAVEIASGFGSLGLAWGMGSRKHKEAACNNAPFVILGASILWFGWMGFNAGSAGSAGVRAAAAIMNTNFVACIAGGVWMICNWIYTRKWSVIALCTGAVAGLACVTPAAGYIGIHSCLALGSMSGLIGFCFATFLDKLLKVDDTFMAFACHGVGGVVGMLLTGIFADKRIICADHQPECASGGWVDRHFIQLAIQLAGTAAAASWSFIITYVIVSVFTLAKVIKPGDADESSEGLDAQVIGEEGYMFMNKAVHAAFVGQGSADSTTVEAELTPGGKPAAAGVPEVSGVVHVEEDGAPKS